MLSLTYLFSLAVILGAYTEGDVPATERRGHKELPVS